VGVKLVPVIVTWMPTGPLIGFKFCIVGKTPPDEELMLNVPEYVPAPFREGLI